MITCLEIDLIAFTSLVSATGEKISVITFVDLDIKVEQVVTVGDEERVWTDLEQPSKKA